MTFSIRQTTLRGRPKWELTVNHPKNGSEKRKRERIFRDTRGEAEAVQKEKEEHYASGGLIWARLKPHEQADVMAVLGEAKELGTTARGLLDYFKTHSGTVKHRTMTLREMVYLTIQTKTTSRRRGRYLAQLQYTLTRFAKGRESLPLSQVTSAMITDFLSTLKGRGGGLAAGDTLLSTYTRLKTMFSVATRNNTYLDSTANPMNHVERPYVDNKAPVILAPDQAEKLLWVCRVTDKQFLPYIVLGLFGGIRPEELEKLRWRDIHLDEGEIVIEEGVSKTRSRRCFDIEPVLLEWLKKECYSEVKAADSKITYTPPAGEYIFECEVKGERIGRGEPIDKVLRNVRQCIKRHRNNLCKRSGVKWSNDILRKTCASFLMWKYDNESKVAAMLGNSPKILHDHYRSLMRRKDGEAFENMTPANVRNDPIALPTGGKGKKAGVLISDENKKQEPTI